MKLPADKERELAVIFLDMIERWRNEKQIEREEQTQHTGVQVSGAEKLGETVS